MDELQRLKVVSLQHKMHVRKKIVSNAIVNDDTITGVLPIDTQRFCIIENGNYLHTPGD